MYWHWRIIPLERGFALWEAYVREARRHVRALGHHAYELQYEDLLADPEPALRALVAFCGLQAKEEEIRRVATRTRPERAYAYRDVPELVRFAARVAPRLHALGYASVVPRHGGRHHVADHDGTCAAVGR